MKVAVVSPYAFDAHGGVQDQVARIVGWLRRSGETAWAVAPGSGGPEGTRHVGGYVSWRANRSRAPIAIAPGTVRRVAEAVDDADVVHVHEPLMPLVSLGALLAATPPMVGTFHADPGRIARGLYRGLRGGVGAALRRLAVVTAVSEVAAAVLPRGLEVRIIPNGIDLEPFASGEDRVAGSVVFVGRDDDRKGLDVLLAAWPEVRRRRPDASLTVVGATRPAPDFVDFLGRVPELDKIRALHRAEILAAPNRGGESFGIVVLEGMAAGCAVVASDLPAFRAVAGSAARYTPVGDPAGLAHALVALLGDDGDTRRLAAEGRRRARRFGREVVLAAYRAAYETALEDS